VPVPFLDLGAAYVELGGEIDAAVERVLASGRYVFGPEVEAFEQEFAAFVGTRHCVAVGSGLDALALVVEARDVSAGDEVVVPAHTFVATWLAATRVGARPVPVDVDPSSYNLDPDRLEAAITPSTRMVIPVHLYGRPAAMDAIAAVAARRDLFILEDAAQAHGARFRGMRAGALGTAAAWSFYPGKNLGAFGDGGAVTTDDDRLAERVRLLRNYGAPEKYRHELAGTNSRLDELQAAVLRVKLRHLEAWNERRRSVAARYLEGLAGTGLVLPESPPDAGHVWHLFVVRTPRRDELRQMLADAGVETGVHYPCAPHRQPVFAELAIDPRSLPVADGLQHEVLSLPMGPHLPDDQIDYVVDRVRAFDG
jgi:dTDP-3-amino-3,4,6-trideoxy-alpha-D-glucose transaminase